MPINPDAVGTKSEPARRKWNSKDALIYALGVGAGAADPLDELEFTTENTSGQPQRCLDGRRVDVAHELADVLPLSCEPTSAGDALGEHNRVVQGFREIESRKFGFLERDQPGAKILGRSSLTLAHALAGTPIFSVFVFAVHRTILPCRK